ncbi:hypothetical protein [Pseudoalteromonas marina]|uniref:Uncharacterized protein n=1 Tax=Pseudoalteromonas marina TaxID=267375 RepID=A0ABT9FIB5_9GAMM|nr:hypothetical protein [Pseudoalteromonas marina]MDP2566414.1 hypothetical protein [Pseudoalteromonas marina]
MTFEECHDSASRFSIYKDWRKADPKAVKVAKQEFWYNRVTSHMTDGRSTWNLVACITDAMKYDCVSNWRKFSLSSYRAAHRNGWLAVCISAYRPAITFKDCLDDARKYATRTEWQLSGGHYYFALSKGWREACCEHMVTGRDIKWDKQACIDDAKKYRTRYEWFSAPKSGYSAAKRLNVFDECVMYFDLPEVVDSYFVKLVA